MGLWSRRERDKGNSEREAAGESLWVESFDGRAVTRLNEIWSQAEAHFRSPYLDQVGPLAEQVATMLRAQGGWKVPDRIYSGALKASDEQVIDLTLDALEAFIKVYAEKGADTDSYVNEVLREHRIGYRIVEHEVVFRGSDELHASVVAPALRLLIGREFVNAHDAYLDALKEITAGKSGDAITDAGTALQEALTALGCTGNALGPLIDDAVRRGILAPHDKKIADWVSADRSTTGDAHHHSAATVADAWLAVHVTGALIVRLADPDRARGSQ